MSMTRLESRFLWTRTRLELREKRWRLDSSHVKNSNRITISTLRLESESFLQNLCEPMMGKASSFAYKEISIFCFSDVQNWWKFPLLTV